MNNVVFAIPGLMPPKAPNWMSKLIAPEDGSLCMLLHAGKIEDVVTYALDIRGVRPGVIKDPDYNYVGGTDAHEHQLPHQALMPMLDRSSWPDFLRAASELPSEIIIPRKVYCGCPIPIDELPELQDLETVWYYILELPVRSLPVGDTTVEVTINGKVRNYTVQRQHSIIHDKSRLTYRYSDYTPIFESMDYITATRSSKRITVAFLLQPILDKIPAATADNLEFKLVASQLGASAPITVTSHSINEDLVTISFTVNTPPPSEINLSIYYRTQPAETAWLVVAEGTKNLTA